MILSPRLIWLHLPRTGGTSTVQVFRDAVTNLPQAFQSEWSIDDDSLRAKHDNLAIRSMRLGLDPRATRMAMNFRPLDDWMLSNWKWARAQGLNVDRSRYQNGEFFSLRLGKWCRADWWLDYFDLTDSIQLIRLTHLEEDLSELMEWAGLKLPVEEVVPRLNGLSSSDGEQAQGFCSELAMERNPIWMKYQRKMWPS